MDIIGGDLKPFYRELENLGFVTFPKSRSNYPYTTASVASMLNMDYFSGELKKKSVSFFAKQIRNNKVMENFKKHGYQVRITTTASPIVSCLYKKPSITNTRACHLCAILFFIRHFVQFLQSC